MPSNEIFVHLSVEIIMNINFLVGLELKLFQNRILKAGKFNSHFTLIDELKLFDISKL